MTTYSLVGHGGRMNTFPIPKPACGVNRSDGRKDDRYTPVYRLAITSFAHDFDGHHDGLTVNH